jgi:hypothetical protein
MEISGMTMETIRVGVIMTGGNTKLRGRRRIRAASGAAFGHCEG